MICARRGLRRQADWGRLPLLSTEIGTPDPQLELQIASLESCNINSLNYIRNTNLLSFWGWGRGFLFHRWTLSPGLLAPNMEPIRLT